MKSFRGRTARLTAVVTGKAKTIGPIEAHERNVLAITRRIHRLLADRSMYRRKLKEVGDELREKRRELRAVLQRESSIADDTLDLAGRADAIDATNARLERA